MQSLIYTHTEPVNLPCMNREDKKVESIPCSISYEDPAYYMYKNIYRVILIINKLNAIKHIKTIDQVFTSFISKENKVEPLVVKFCSNLELFITSYMSLKFSGVSNILVRESTEPILSYFPSFMWLDNSIIKLVYDPVKIRQLMNRYVSIMIIGGDTFIPDMDKLKNESNDTIKSNYDMAALELSNRFLSKNSTPCNREVTYLKGYMADSSRKNLQFIDRDIQRNVKEIWVKQNLNVLLVVMGMVEILEQIILPIIDAQAGDTRLIPTLTVTFPSSSRPVYRMADGGIIIN